ncbi:MAG TPA: nuclear transport factor 2 family protein [Chitinophagaceae bacterium]|jgi:hypothetical protein|nr:nuclear transport factor 2 family protein [Chitinophagaceae bacterium]
MKLFKFILLTGISTGLFFCYSQSSKNEKMSQFEKIIHNYFGGWEKKNWNLVSSQLAEGFTFTSPNNDDHISIERFKEKCWVQADHIKKFEFVKIIGNDKEAFALMHVITDHDKTIRNIEYFTFSNGKIKAIEVFFGGTGQGFPTNEK